jgi:hypothetical protein
LRTNGERNIMRSGPYGVVAIFSCNIAHSLQINQRPPRLRDTETTDKLAAEAGLQLLGLSLQGLYWSRMYGHRTREFKRGGNRKMPRQSDAQSDAIDALGAVKSTWRSASIWDSCLSTGKNSNRRSKNLSHLCKDRKQWSPSRVRAVRTH